MLARVLDALTRAGSLGPVIVCTEDPTILNGLDSAACYLPAAHGPSASVARALKERGMPILMTTADHPLLRPEWIERFLDDAKGCDLAVGIATRTVIDRDVPGTKRTYIKLRDMHFSGCNLFLFATPAAAKVVTLWQKLERDRKKPWRMAATLGPSVLIRALCGTLTSEGLCRHLQKLTGATVRLVPMADGRAAVDVDKPADLSLVEQLITAG